MKLSTLICRTGDSHSAAYSSSSSLNYDNDSDFLVMTNLNYLLPGPLAKLAADKPIRCFPAWLPEKPREMPKSRPLFCVALSHQLGVLA